MTWLRVLDCRRYRGTQQCLLTSSHQQNHTIDPLAQPSTWPLTAHPAECFITPADMRSTSTAAWPAPSSSSIRRWNNRPRPRAWMSEGSRAPATTRRDMFQVAGAAIAATAVGLTAVPVTRSAGAAVTEGGETEILVTVTSHCCV